MRPSDFYEKYMPYKALWCDSMSENMVDGIRYVQKNKVSEEDFKRFLEDGNKGTIIHIFLTQKTTPIMMDILLSHLEKMPDCDYIPFIISKEMSEKQFEKFIRIFDIHQVNEEVEHPSTNHRYNVRPSQSFLRYMISYLHNTKHEYWTDYGAYRCVEDGFDGFVRNMLDTWDLNEIELSGLVSNKNLPDHMRIEAYEKGCDMNAIDYSKKNKIPEKILTNIYESVSQNCFEYKDTYVGTEPFFVMHCMLHENQLPYACAMDLLMRFAATGDRSTNAILESLLIHTDDENILAEATKLKNKDKHFAYENVYMPKGHMIQHLYTLLDKVDRTKISRKIVPEAYIKIFAKANSHIVLPDDMKNRMIDTENFYMKFLAYRNSVMSSYATSKTLFEKGLEDKNEWIRAYARLGLMRVNEEIPTSNFVRVEKLLQFFHMELNNDYKYSNRHSNDGCGFTCELHDFEEFVHRSLYHYPRIAQDVLDALNVIQQDANICFGGRFLEFEEYTIACNNCEHRALSKIEEWTDRELDYKLRSIAFELWKEDDNATVGGFLTNEQYVMAHSTIEKLYTEVERREKEKSLQEKQYEK